MGSLIMQGTNIKNLRTQDKYHNYVPYVTLSLLMSCNMELLVKPEILTSYIYGPTFGNAESRLFLLAAKRFNTESMQKVILYHIFV
jgi:hypothetical protein